MNQLKRARYFRRLHDRLPLILLNVSEVGNARVIEAAGAEATATTIACVS